MKTFGPPRKESAGTDLLKYITTTRLTLRVRELVKRKITTPAGEEEIPVMAYIIAMAIKNKLAPPYREAYFTILFGKRVFDEHTAIELGAGLSQFFTKNGSVFKFVADPDPAKRWDAVNLSGTYKAAAFLSQHKELRDLIMAEIISEYERAIKL